MAVDTLVTPTSDESLIAVTALAELFSPCGSARTGRASIANIDFYLAYNMFRLAAILQGIAKRAIDGTAANAQAVETGKRARPTGEAGWALAECIIAAQRR